MKALGLPTVPGTEGLLEDVNQASRAAAEVGYPVLLKATAGGGGKGMRRCADEEGRSVLLVTHNPRDASYADKVLFLLDGALDADTVLEGPDIQVEQVHEALAGLSI